MGAVRSYARKTRAGIEVVSAHVRRCQDARPDSRSDLINTDPLRAPDWRDMRRQSFELGCDRLRCGIERLFLQFEKDHGLRPGEAAELMLNTGMNRLGAQR
jgi:hypothetical protein